MFVSVDIKRYKMNDNNITSEFIGIEEFCRLTGWKRNTSYKYLTQIPELRIYHFGRFIRLKRTEVEKWVRDNTI